MHHEGSDVCPMRTECKRMVTDRVLSPYARIVARDVVNVHSRLGMVGAVIGAHRQNSCRCGTSDCDSVALILSVRNCREVFSEPCVEGWLLRRPQSCQRVVRRSCDGGIS